MGRASHGTMQLGAILLLCVAVTFTPGRCGTKEPRDEQRARLPEFLSELDLSSLDASEEDVEALKKVVKRLAPEKNGVTGQPGVDFPALTTIPVTSFSCRGLKGGYYADLETNCQVFHICDNGRKISFLCPNGTIFQQSQLICDWWFKVDCSKSTELYEQSAEQLAEEERKRAEAKRMNSEFHRGQEERSESYERNVEGDGNYDGRQNGRMNPYGLSPKQNQIQDNQRSGKQLEQTSQTSFNEAARNQYQQVNDPARNQYQQVNDPGYRDVGRGGNSEDQYYQRQELGFHATSRQQNQLVSEPGAKTDQYNERGAGKYQKERQGYRDGPNKSQDYYGSAANENAPRTERPSVGKSRATSRSNVNNLAGTDPKVTPTYTETTTFRTTTSSPVQEFQQLAESAAFVSSRGNHYNNKHYNSQQFGYQANRFTASENSERHQSTTSLPGKNRNEPATLRTRFSIPPFPGPTFAPIYKPRTTTTTAPTTYETTSQPVTTVTPAYNADHRNGQNYQSETPYPPYTRDQDYQTTTETYYSQQNGSRFQETTYGWNSQQDQTTQRYDPNYYAGSGSPGNYNDNTSNYKDNGASVEQTTQAYDQNYYGNTDAYKSNAVTSRDVSQDTAVYPTTGTYVNSDNRQNAGGSQAITEPTVQDYSGRTSTVPTTNYYNNANQNNWNSQTENDSRFTTRNPPRTSQSNRQNSISASTEKPFRNTQSYQQNNYQNTGATGKTLSPYDTSFTYKQGKVMSTLGPYVPFTKNYVYPVTTTTTTTSKPPVYTATVPTYSSTIANYRVTAKNLIPKIKSATASPGKSKTAATYLPESSTRRLTSLENRPKPEREHALSMLQSLSQLESNVPGLSSKYNGSGVSGSSGPSTLHSLALYFATANDSYDSKEATDSAISIQYQPPTQVTSTPKTDNTTIELPTSILTQHTINSYAELFNLNNALEGNATAAESFINNEDFDEHDDPSDLDIDESEGPVNGAKKSNGTKLRELAQVFTHALSAYLQDPDTFKKVLTEIRPTEPPLTTMDDQNEITTQYPTTIDEYPSVTKERDEVLDFSDDTNGVLRRKPGTYSTTTLNPQTTENDYRTRYPSDYYTTPYPPLQDNRYDSTTPTPDEIRNEGQSYHTTPTSNTYAFAVNRAFSQGNELSSYNPSGPDGSQQSYENYFPTAYGSVGVFRNDTTNTHAPYGKYVKPSDARPIGANYVVSSTPASYDQQTNVYDEPSGSSGAEQLDLELAPPLFESYGSLGNSPPAGFRAQEKDAKLAEKIDARTTTAIPIEIIGASSTSQPFRIRYYEAQDSQTGDNRSSEESLATARSTYSSYKSGYESGEQQTDTTTTSSTLSRTLEPVTTVVSSVDENSRQQNTVPREIAALEVTEGTTQSPDSNNRWTLSPEVTQLWESTVYVDPERINHGLESSQATTTTTTTTAPTTDYPATERTIRSTTSASSGLEMFTDVSNDSPKSWQWSPNNNDSPTGFTLLPSAFGRENTATPTPIYTTSSSITTTITSSVTSTSTLPQETLLPSSLARRTGVNATENEIARAQEMFGRLNASSTDTLMKVMRQADKNATVRQLVLLLINHCNGPTNKTMEEEKEQLLDALLRMPVNEFSSEESREIVAGISKLSLPIGRARFVPISSPEINARSATTTTTTTTTTRPLVTTFRSRKGRKFRTSTPVALSRRSDDGKDVESGNSLDDTSASDGRALELLRSLYTIAAKWG